MFSTQINQKGPTRTEEDGSIFSNWQKQRETSSLMRIHQSDNVASRVVVVADQGQIPDGKKASLKWVIGFEKVYQLSR